MIDFIKNNYEWAFGGIGVVVITFLGKKFFKENQTNQPAAVSSEQNIIINNNLNSFNQDEFKGRSADERLKDRTRILFIDDMHTDFKMVSILKKAGWLNTKSVKDITDLDDQKILEADIVFVDINGVGRTLFEDQGLGLASTLKTKYPKKKIVLYSAESSGDRFHRALREVDDCLAKNAEPYQFINLVESFAKEFN